MGGFRPETDRNKVDDLEKQIGDIIDSQIFSDSGNEQSSVFGGYGARSSAHGDDKGNRSSQPVLHAISEIDLIGAATGVFDNIVPVAETVILDAVAAGNITVKNIHQFIDGEILKITPAIGRVIDFVTGGNIALPSGPFSITDQEMCEVQYFANTNTYKCISTGSSGGGTAATQTAPIALLKMDGDVLDSIGTNNGTVTGTTAFADGAIGQAFSFDGASYITLANEPNFDFEWNSPFSIQVTTKNTQSTGNRSWVSKGSQLTGVTGWYIFQNSGQPFFNLVNTTGTSEIRVRSSIVTSDDKEHVVLITYDGSGDASGVSFIVDGVLDTSPSPQTDNLDSNTILNADPVTIGAESDGEAPYTGFLDSVAIYDQKLSVVEGRNNYLNSILFGHSGGNSGSASEPYGTTLQTPSSASGVLTINLNFHTHRVTVDEDITSIVFSNLPGAGQSRDFRIRFNHDNIGGTFSVQFPASAGSNSFVLSSGQSAVYVLHTEDQGVSYEIDTLIGTAFVGTGGEFPTWTQDHNASLNDLLGVKNIDFDGPSSTIEGLHNLQFAQTAQSINSLAGQVLYQVAALDSHRFAAGGAEILRAEEITAGVYQLDMLAHAIKNSREHSFDNTTEAIIINTEAVIGYSPTTEAAMLYNVPDTKKHIHKINDVDIMTLSQGNLTFSDGLQVIFNPDSTNPGVNVGLVVGDPTATNNGDIWYNSSTNKLRTKINDVNVNVVSSGQTSFFDDNEFAIFDNLDSTKIAVFRADGIATGTTRTYTFPNLTGFITLTDGAQELADKTLDRPLIKDTDASSTQDRRLDVRQGFFGTYSGTTQVRAISRSSLELITDTEISGTANIAKSKISGFSSGGRWEKGDLTLDVCYLDETQTFVNQKTFGASGTSLVCSEQANFNGNMNLGNDSNDTLTMNGTVDSDITLDDGQRLKPSSGDTIGIIVADQTGSVGTFGTNTIPVSTTGVSSASVADSRFGNFDGALGFQDLGTGSPLLFIRQTDGNWSSVLMGRDALT